MKEQMTDKRIMEKLTKEEGLEYQRLKGTVELAKALGKEIPEDVAEKLEQYKTKVKEKYGMPKEDLIWDFEDSQDIQGFRKLWKERIQGIDDEIKENIIQVSDQIPVTVKKDGEGNKLIEFGLNGKRYKILDANLKIHSNNKYYNKLNYNMVSYKGMMGSEIENWENKKLKEFVKEQESKGWHMPTMEEMKNLARELGTLIKAKNRGDGIAMLMYLTGMNGLYRLSSVFGENSRCKLICNANSRQIDFFDTENYASFCMMAYE